MPDLKCPNCGASASLPLGLTCSDHRPVPVTSEPAIPDELVRKEDGDRVNALPPVAYLLCETLAARYRLGEPFWPLPNKPRIVGALRDLSAAGFAEWEHDGPGSVRAWLTQRGLNACLSDSYVSPLVQSFREQQGLARLSGPGDTDEQAWWGVRKKGTNEPREAYPTEGKMRRIFAEFYDPEKFELVTRTVEAWRAVDTPCWPCRGAGGKNVADLDGRLAWLDCPACRGAGVVSAPTAQPHNALTVRLVPDQLDGGWIASVDELPGLMAQGDTTSEAVGGIADAITEYAALTAAQPANDEATKRAQMIAEAMAPRRGSDGLMHDNDCRYHDRLGCASQPRMEPNFNPWGGSGTAQDTTEDR